MKITTRENNERTRDNERTREREREREKRERERERNIRMIYLDLTLLRVFFNNQLLNNY